MLTTSFEAAYLECETSMITGSQEHPGRAGGVRKKETIGGKMVPVTAGVGAGRCHWERVLGNQGSIRYKQSQY